MSEQAYLELQVGTRDFLEVARILRDLPNAAAAAEAGMQKWVRATEDGAAKAAAAAEKAARREADAWNDALQKALGRYDKQAAAAEKAAQRQAQVAERAAARENEAWNNALQRSLARYEKQAEAAEKAARREAEAAARGTGGGVGGGILAGLGGGALVGGAAGIAASLTSGAVGLAKDFVGDLMNVTREFDKLNAALITVTGSSKEAGKVFDVLQDFAAKTPYNIEQSVNAFVQLKTLGLDATERSLKAFGDMAAAFGDSMDHMLLAVGDAVMGINRPLKQFGIHAEDASSHSKKFGSEIEKVKFTFRGHSTEVEKSAKAIQDYLITLSEENFSQAMINRLHTLDGQLSNVSDNWHRFEQAIMRSGLEDSLTGVAEKLADILKTLSEIAKTTVKPAIQGVKNVVGATISAIPLLGPAANLAANAYHPGAVITDEMMQAEQDRLKKYAADEKKLQEDKQAEEYRSLVKSLVSKREALDAWHKHARDVALAGLNEYDKGMDQGVSDVLNKIEKKYEADLAAINKKEGKEYQKELNAFNRMAEQVEKKADPLSQASADYDEKKRQIEKFTAPGSNRRKMLMEDLGDVYQQEIDKYIKAYTKDEVEQEKHIKAVEDSLARQVDSTKALYDKNRQTLLDANLKDGELWLANEAMYQRHLDEKARKAAVAEAQRQKQHDEAMSLLVRGDDKIMAEAMKQADEYEKLVAKNILTEQEFVQLKVQLHIEANRKIAESNLEHMQQMVTMSGAMFGSLATAAKNWGGETSAVYRGLFNAQKAFAVASTTVAMFQDIAKAESEGGPYMGPIIALSVAGRFAQILSQLSSTQYSGAYDDGGYIPSGKIGLVGERGPELVRGPANVTSRVDTARMAAGAGHGSDAPRIINVWDDESAQKVFNNWAGSANGQRAIMNVVRLNEPTMRTF